ncbi:hypothetical protein BDQ17DRAFT_1378194, partial [Cyathus striatus]
MPRRPPPTSLRLVHGPVPSRSTPKHTLPSVPRPAFHPQTVLERVSPVDRAKSELQHRPELSVSILYAKISTVEGSPLSQMSPPSQSPKGKAKKLRGPWDHSGSIRC